MNMWHITSINEVAHENGSGCGALFGYNKIQLALSVPIKKSLKFD